MQNGQCTIRHGLATPPTSPRSSLEAADAAAANFLLQQACAQQQQQQQQIYARPVAPPSPVDSPVPQNATPLAVTAPEQRLGQLIGGRYLLEQVAGVGAYGVVYMARDVQTNLPYAIKALNKVGLDARQERFQRREILHHHQACRVGPADFHPNIVSLLKLIESPECLYAVLEYCPEGDLFMNITERQRYFGKDTLIRQVFLQILDAVEHCHRRGIYHRDLKPENILVADDGCTVKLADFGLATMDARTADHGCGSQFYMSPECLQPQPLGYESAPNDIWSLGVILVNLTCGRNPWRKAAMDDSTYRGFMNDRTFLQSILPLTSELNFILTRMFEPDPMRRATIPELRSLMSCCTRLTTTSHEIMPMLPLPDTMANPRRCLQPMGFQAGMYPHTRFDSTSQTSFSSNSSASSVDSTFSASSAHSSCSSNSSVSQLQDAQFAKDSEICAPVNPVVVGQPELGQACWRVSNFRDILHPFQQYAYKQQPTPYVADEYVFRLNRPSFFLRPEWQQCFRFGHQLFGH